MATQKEIMRFELIMDAGNGAQKAGDILIKAFAKSGRFVFIEPLIPAEISPPKRTPHSMSGAVIRVSTNELSNMGSTSDLMLFEHEILLERRLKDSDYTIGGLVLLDMADERRAKDAYAAVIEEAKSVGLKVISFNMDDESVAIIKELNGNGKNMYYLGMMAAIYEMPEEYVAGLIRQVFKKLSEEKLNKNLTIYANGYKNALEVCPETFDIPKTEKSMTDSILLDGNTSLAMGIIDAGIRFYAGYPITPASSIMHSLSKAFPAYGGMVHQAEDEISAVGAMIGSYYAGVPAVTATSGPGLSLKQEFIGLANSAEIPSIIINVQRGGPSTGLPTRTEQTDLFASVFGTHGESPKVAISVSNVEDCFYVPHVARYITEKLRAPVIILSDYITSVSYKVLEKLPLLELDDINDISDDILARFNIKRLPDTIEMVKDNQANPGVPDKMRRVTGLNTDASGNVVYSSESNQRSHDIRNEKLEVVRRALTSPEIIGAPTGDLLLVCWGSSRGVVEEAINLANQEGIKVSALNFKIVYPLPTMLSEIFKKFKKVVTIEVAFGKENKPTEFSTLLRSETLVDIGLGLAQATGRPLKPKSVLARIKDLV